MSTALTPYPLRRLLTFLPLLAVGIAEAIRGKPLKGDHFLRLERWGTWRNP